MKLDRLIGILSILLQQEKVTAPYLAEKFEVSRRTINRDIDSLCMAGIPIATAQGANGGIFIAQGYKVDKTFLTNPELQDILAGLKSLDSVANTDRYGSLVRKLNVCENEIRTADSSIVINLGSWYLDTLTPKIQALREAIRLRRVVTFRYLSPHSDATRSVRPYTLVFQWASWYLWGYCLLRGGWRMFKLNRMQDLQTEQETFEREQVAPPTFDPDRIFPARIEAVLRIHPSYCWKVSDEYGPGSFSRQSDGSLIFRFGFADRENLFSWIMSFCGGAELLEPAALREEFGQLLTRLSEQYRST